MVYVGERLAVVLPQLVAGNERHRHVDDLLVGEGRGDEGHVQRERNQQDPRDQRQRGLDLTLRHRLDTRADRLGHVRGRDDAERQHDRRVADVAARMLRLPRNKVVEALGHAELHDPVERRVDQEELLVGAELGRREHACAPIRGVERMNLAVLAGDVEHANLFGPAAAIHT